jgi:lambda family phage portal protein
LNFNEELNNGNQVRMGIEFNASNQRVAYHFWRVHPDDTTAIRNLNLDLRVRVAAAEVLHLMPGRTASQIRGVSRFARAIIPIFTADVYDDAEIARKHAAALFSVFIKKTGEAGPLDAEDADGEDEDGNAAVQMQPGAVITLDEGEDISPAAPADVGGSYEPFQYRTTLRIATATGIPYAYLTGDTTRGNFSNVRTEIMNFRRRVSQHQFLWTIPQLCGPVWHWFLNAVESLGLADVVDDFRDEDHGVPRSEWLDPLKDIQAEIKAVRAGFKNRAHVIASLGYEREEIDRERKKENTEADRDGLIFDTDARRTTGSGTSNAVASGSGYASPDNELPDADEVEADQSASPSERSGA